VNKFSFALVIGAKKTMLHNTQSAELLKRNLEAETFPRITFSFYRYAAIDNPETFRNTLFLTLSQFRCLGRIYVAHEGINAQMNVPENSLAELLAYFQTIAQLTDIPIKYAVEETAPSFLKLIIKVRPKIVADGLPDDTFDTSNVGRHLTAEEFHQAMDNPGTLVVDMRNNYESEVGRFEGAICPDAVTFREELQLLPQLLDHQKQKKILLYCTGGVRCEKASAYLRHLGYEDVNQLHGGIIDYVRQIKQARLSSRFKGKNFVFDNRIGERVTADVIATCHQCGAPCDTHVNCANDSCHLLFIQCAACSEKYHGCCSDVCASGQQIPVVRFAGKRYRRANGTIERLAHG
jgi:UPF0176 protein